MAQVYKFSEKEIEEIFAPFHWHIEISPPNLVIEKAVISWYSEYRKESGEHVT